MPGSTPLRSGQEVSVEEGALEGTSVFSFLKTDRPPKVSPDVLSLSLRQRLP